MAKSRILLVQNTQTQGNGTRTFLENRGYDVLGAGSGLSALITARNAAADLILLDVALPDMEGLDLCRRFKKRDDTSSIPIIMLVGRGYAPDPFSRPGGGPDAYLEKPVQEQELHRVISESLRMNRVLTAAAAVPSAPRGAGPFPMAVPSPATKPANRPALKLVERTAPEPLRAPAQQTTPADAVVDPATGLFSRQQFEAMFTKEFKQCQRFMHHMSCMMIDLDGRKMGRMADAALVKDIIGLVQNTIREVDTAAWWTGESLVVLLPNTIRNDAVQAAARILEAVASHPFPWSNATQVTMSIGVAGLPDWSITSEQQLIDAAAAACKKALDGMENLQRPIGTHAAEAAAASKKAAG